MNTHQSLPLLIALISGGCADPRTVVFGETPGVLEATDINPGCEEITSGAEFSSTFVATVNGWKEDKPVLDIIAEPLEEATPREFSLDLEVDLGVGDEICVESTGTEEDDELLDDRMTEDTDCRVVGDGDTDYVFELAMTTGGCTLSAMFPATVE